jgi:anti-repressor protein
MDVAKILDYVKVDKMLNLVDDEDKRTENPHKLNNSILEETFDSNTFRVSLINESGVYACIFGSTKPEAKMFKRWVTSELQ